MSDLMALLNDDSKLGSLLGDLTLSPRGPSASVSSPRKELSRSASSSSYEPETPYVPPERVTPRERCVLLHWSRAEFRTLRSYLSLPDVLRICHLFSCF